MVINIANFFYIVILLFQFISGQHIPSAERGDPNYRRNTDLDVNQVRSTIHNWGYTGKTSEFSGYGYEWPVNSGNEYIWLTGLAVGSEIISIEGDSSVLVSTILRTDASGKSISWEPVKEYLNTGSSKIAISSDPNSWPEYWIDKIDDGGWPESWNGYFGKDKFSAEQEIFYKISDDNNNPESFTYYPDSTDEKRRGLGLLSGVRVMQWKQILIEDVIFQLFDIKNDGTEDLNKVAFSLWYADYIGQDGNDKLEFDLLEDVAWNYDLNHDDLGYVAISYIETPGNNIDRIDNDGDATPNDNSRCDIDYHCELGGPIITENMLIGEVFDGKDNNGNGLIDENESHLSSSFASIGVSFADGIDNDGDSELGGPIITENMLNEASIDWGIWPPPSSNNGVIHLIGLDVNDIGMRFKDNIGNDNICFEDIPYFGCDIGSPLITEEMILIASEDIYKRFYVINPTGDTLKILYDVGDEDLGLPFADGIDNDGDGAIDEGIDDNIDEMIDESRDDYLDNDGDWVKENDVGINGSGFGEGAFDGVPSSGSGTGFPGEPNIDKTDVSESDQMGLTSVTWKQENSGINNDSKLFWTDIMTPGILEPPIGTDNDLFVSSGYFPLKAGQTERIAMAISLGNDEQDALRNRKIAQTAYESDYQFAKSPIAPTVRAVAGNNQITLYWDSIAEDSEDPYMEKITDGAVRYDFEGYKIYRSTDWQFSDSYTITDGDGNPTFYKPYVLNGESCQWDLIDGKNGWHPVSLNGVKYYLGDDTGLVHSFTDTDVINGQRYYYAVVSYDFGGDLTNNIIPSDSPMRLRINSLTGEVDMGSNVVEVIPVEPAAGYVDETQNKNIEHFGLSDGKVSYQVIDPLEILSDHTYRITFSDSAFYTKGYYLIDISNSLYPDTLMTNYDIEKKYQPIIDGFQIEFENIDSVSLDTSYWNGDSLWDINLDIKDFKFVQGAKVPANYRIIFSDSSIGSSECYCAKWSNPSLDPCAAGVPLEVAQEWCSDLAHLYLPSPTNFIVEKKKFNDSTQSFIWDSIPFAFYDVFPALSNPDNLFNADTLNFDYCIFLDGDNSLDNFQHSWVVNLQKPSLGDPFRDCCSQPSLGDTLYINIKKPFLSTDSYEFSPKGPYIDKDLATNILNDIYVIPNPYIAANQFESDNIYTSGRGPREIQFRNLPSNCIIRIYSVSGERIKTIKHNSSINNGMESWNLLTKDNLSLAYGVYIYHVDAPGIGEHIGKFAVIK